MADPQHAAPGSSRRVTFQLEATRFPEKFDISPDPNNQPTPSCSRQRVRQPGSDDPNPYGDGSETGSRPFRVLCLSKKDLCIALAIFVFGVALSCSYYFVARLLYRRESSVPWAWQLRKNDNGIPRILLWNRIIRPLSFDLNVPDLHTRWSSNVTACPLEGDISVLCEITDNRSRLMWSDAIVFEADRLDTLDLPSERHELPRHPEFPMWILWAQNHLSPSSELPRNFNVRGHDEYCKGIRTRFNWTMGHREDADIVVPYKSWRCGMPGDVAVAATVERNREAVTRSRHLKQAAWIVSTCEQHGYQLMRYRHRNEETDTPHDHSIPLVYLDLFRDCASGICQTRHQCLRYIAANYYFLVVRLEPDCFHSQYELIYDAFEYDLVPVVLVPPNTTLNVPPHSVVSSADLQRPGELATFLNFLIRSRVEYKRYFEWKKHCSLIPNDVELCPLCRAFHEKSARQQKHPDAYDWWTARSICHGYTPSLYGLDWAFVDSRDPWVF